MEAVSRPSTRARRRYAAARVARDAGLDADGRRARMGCQCPL